MPVPKRLRRRGQGRGRRPLCGSGVPTMAALRSREMRHLLRNRTPQREGRRGNAKDAEEARRLRGLCVSLAAVAQASAGRRRQRFSAKDAEEARRLRGLCASFAASALNVFFSVPEITPLTRRTQRRREGRGGSSAPSRALRLLRGRRVECFLLGSPK